MMKIDQNRIKYVAELARLELTENEQDTFSEQLSSIINYVEKINELDTSSVDPASHVEDTHNVLRDDLVKPSIDPDEIKRMAPEFEDSHIVVPKIIEGGE